MTSSESSRAQDRGVALSMRSGSGLGYDRGSDNDAGILAVVRGHRVATVRVHVGAEECLALRANAVMSESRPLATTPLHASGASHVRGRWFDPSRAHFTKALHG
jgi:hypothetical protein